MNKSQKMATCGLRRQPCVWPHKIYWDFSNWTLFSNSFESMWLMRTTMFEIGPVFSESALAIAARLRKFPNNHYNLNPIQPKSFGSHKATVPIVEHSTLCRQLSLQLSLMVPPSPFCNHSCVIWEQYLSLSETWLDTITSGMKRKKLCFSVGILSIIVSDTYESSTLDQF